MLGKIFQLSFLNYTSYEDVEQAVRTWFYYIKELRQEHMKLKFFQIMEKVVESAEMVKINVEDMTITVIPLEDIEALDTLKKL